MGLSIEEQREKIRNRKKELSKKYLEQRHKNKFYLIDYFVKGIYFLHRGNRIVYIGKSDGNVFKRICLHYDEKIKDFDSFTFKKYNLPDKALLRAEKELIKKYKPIYNKVHNTQKKIKIIYGMSRA